METSREKIISLELQDPDKSDTPNASIDLMTQHENVEREANELKERLNVDAVNVQHNQEQMMPQQLQTATRTTTHLLETQVSEDEKPLKGKGKLQLPEVARRTLVETVERLHFPQKSENTNDDESNNKEMEKEQQEHLDLDVNDGYELVLEEKENMEEDLEEEDEETDTASIVTVQQNTEKLFLRNDDDEFPSIELDSLSSGGIFGPSSLESVGSGTKVSIKPSTITMHQTLAKEVVLPTTTKVTTTLTTKRSKSYQGMDDDDEDDDYECEYDVAAAKTITKLTPASTSKTQSIVEVVNPLITGEGQVQRIAFSRSHRSEYPSFDDDDDEEEEDEEEHYVVKAEAEEDFEKLPSSMQILRSETFVMPPTKAREELSLNAKMKNVLEELLENERVKYNLQKSLEEESNNDESKPAYGDDYEDDDDDEQTKDEIDFGVSQTSRDNNGNRHVLNALIRDSNKNTLQKLQEQLRQENEDDEDDDDDEENEYEVAEDEEEDEDEVESEESEESESSDSDDDDDDDDETIHITFVDGAKVIENFNTNTPMKLQKSQTYNTMKEAAEAMTEKTDESSEKPQETKTESQTEKEEKKDTQTTLEKLLAEQQKYAEISKQLRKSVENLLIDDDDEEKKDLKDISELGAATTTTSTITSYETLASSETPQKPKTKKVVVTKKSTKSKPLKERSSLDSETGEEIFNRLLEAGGSRKQIFDQETDETLTSSTTTSCTEDNGTIITTTTTTISNVTTSGIPRVTKHVEKVVKTKANKNNNNGKDKNDDGDDNYDEDHDHHHHHHTVRDNDGEA